MKYQVFTRQSHVGGQPTPGSKPRRVCIVDTIEAARAYCQPRNAKRSKAQVRDGFHYEFAALDWYTEAFL